MQAVDIIRQVFGLLTGPVVNSSRKTATAHIKTISSRLSIHPKEGLTEVYKLRVGGCRLSKWDYMGTGVL